MRRLFIGIEVPNSVKAVALNAKAILEKEVYGARWVPPENVHLTIKFLGDCREEQVGEVARQLESSAGACVALTCKTTSFGVFPNLRKARIFWLGVEEKQELKEIHKEINKKLATVGFEVEKRVFHPHITLARIKKPQPIEINMINSRIKTTPSFDIKSITLFVSHLTPAGARYEVLGKFRLK